MAKGTTVERQLRYAIVDRLIEANLKETRASREATIRQWRQQEIPMAQESRLAEKSDHSTTRKPI